MFEYDSNPKRPRSFHLWGLLYFVVLISSVAFWQSSRDRFGEFACVLPAGVLFAVMAIQNRIVNQRRARLVEADGLVMNVESDATPELDAEGVFHVQDVEIRFKLPSGEPYTVELSGLYRFSVGDTVPVLYDPEHPEHALPTEERDYDLYEGPRLLGRIVLFMLVFGCFVASFSD